MQLVGYDRSPDPALVLASDGVVDRVSLTSGTELGYRLGDRHCAGDRIDDAHEPCAAAAVPWCPDHTRTWVCARCRGACSLPTAACTEPHAVYLALFAPDLVKVGVTKRRRIERRLAEQGADRGAVLFHAANGRIARRIECRLADRYPDRVRTPVKLRGLSAAVDDDTWASLIDRYRPHRTIRPEYGFAVSRQPIPATIAHGTVRGVKGRLLVLDHGGTAYVADLRELVGHDVEYAPDDGPVVQQDLVAFDR